MIYCDNCGAKLIEGQQTCDMCGKKATKTKQKKRPHAAIIVMLCLLLGISVAFGTVQTVKVNKSIDQNEEVKKLNDEYLSCKAKLVTVEGDNIIKTQSIADLSDRIVELEKGESFLTDNVAIIYSGDSYYHTFDCNKNVLKNYSIDTVEDAKDKGYKECENCHPHFDPQKALEEAKERDKQEYESMKNESRQ